MLSHLILSTKDDEQALSSLIRAESNSFIIIAQAISVGIIPMLLLPSCSIEWPSGVPPIALSPCLGARGLRAPPTC